MNHHVLCDLEGIKKILPHRSPFLFVDRVIGFTSGQEITAEKDLSADEPYFAGHFPQKPIMPGVLIGEALAQASGLLLGLTYGDKGDDHSSREAYPFVLASLDIKFVATVRPGVVLGLGSRLLKSFGNLSLFKVTASIDNRQVAGGTLKLAKVSGAERGGM